MPLVNPREILVRARDEHWALGGFNAYNLESARAVISAASELDSPVIVQFSPGAISHAGVDNVVSLVKRLAGDTHVPVSLHLDHGKDPELAKSAILAGFTSVMIDASHHPIEENISQTHEIVMLADEHGVTVEAELGQISGIEDLGDVDVEGTFTDPGEAERFVAETGVGSLAIAIGTAHGSSKFNGQPRLDFDRLTEIATRIKIPLVLHGASAVAKADVERAEKYGADLPAAQGIPTAFIEKAIDLGISKINTDSDLRLAALGAIRQMLTEKPDLFNMYQLMGVAENAMKDAVSERIRLFWSVGKA